MRVFLAGATGVIGARLLPLLAGRGRDVTALVRDRSKGRIVADALDAPRLTAAIAEAEREVLLHQLIASAGFSVDFRNLGAEPPRPAVRTPGRAGEGRG